MLINESGLVRAMKNAYKHGGYTVVNQEKAMFIYTEFWFIRCKRDKLPRKVLVTIVEHMGMIPDETGPVSIIKDTDPQMVVPEVANSDMDHWRSGQREDVATMVPVIMQGYQIYQPPGGGACFGVSLLHLGMIEREEAEHQEADIVDGDRLLFEGDEEVVVITAVRKATADSWAKKWERAVWAALESVDLHKEES